MTQINDKEHSTSYFTYFYLQKLSRTFIILVHVLCIGHLFSQWHKNKKTFQRMHGTQLA